MKEPKTFKYPRMYYCHGYGELCSCIEGPRIRIIYPSGLSEWLSLSKHPDSQYNTEWIFPCWLDLLAYNLGNSTGKKALRQMRTYDKKLYFKKAIFLGEIK